jgi:hypothetical protein
MTDSIFNVLNNIATFAAIIQFIIIIVGFGVYINKYWFSRFFLGFSHNKNDKIDIVITTSEIKKDDIGGIHAARATTGIGQILGISIISRVIGKLYGKKNIEVQLSELIVQRPDKDLVLLGGPSKNKLTKKYIRKLNEEHPSLNFEFDDVNLLLRIKDLTISEPNLDIDKDGKVDTDYAVVLCSSNPFSAKNRRLILCAGFTSYGTAGGVVWLFEDVLSKGYKSLKKINHIGVLKKPSFAAIIKVDVVKNQIVATECIRIIQFRD